MARPATLSRERIVDAAVALVAERGAEHLTVRALGDVLGCDPSALYRHFRNVDDLHRAVGDHFLADIDTAPRSREGWRSAVKRLCIELRAAQIRQPRLAQLVRSAPTRLGNELAFSEALLRELRRGGLRSPAAVRAYHALIEFTVGSAAIDASMAQLPVATRDATYQAWRDDYAALDGSTFPQLRAAAPQMYLGSADDRFADALDLMLAGLMSRRTTTH
jgi:AcrR family transcriptional regulator